MTVTVCRYIQNTDYNRVGDFLTHTYRTDSAHINWLLSRWEYMHYYPYIRNVDLSTIGLWEDDGEIVAVIHPEHEKARPTSRSIRSTRTCCLR